METATHVKYLTLPCLKGGFSLVTLPEGNETTDGLFYDREPLPW